MQNVNKGLRSRTMVLINLYRELRIKDVRGFREARGRGGKFGR